MDALLKYTSLVYFFKRTLSSSYEVLLLDTRQPDLPVVATTAKNRDNENAVRGFVSSALKDPRLLSQGMVLNRGLEMDYAKLIRASAFFLKDDQEQVIGALCLMMNCNPYLKLQEILGSVLDFDLSETDQTPVDPIQELTPREPSLDMIREAIANADVEPSRMTQAEKQELICDLYDLNAFRVKGGVAEVAQGLKMSEQSIYRYIAKIKRARGEK